MTNVRHRLTATCLLFAVTYTHLFYTQPIVVTHGVHAYKSAHLLNALVIPNQLLWTLVVIH